MQPPRDSGRLPRNRNKHPSELGRSNRPSAGRVRIIFYPKDSQGRKIDTYLPAKGGEIKVPPGHYSAVIYNYDTEVVQIKDEGSYETIMACTGNCTGLGAEETKDMVWGPDNFYVATLDDVEIGKEEELPTLEVKPKSVVTTYTFSIKTEGLKNVASILGSVSGMAECYHLGKGASLCRFAPIYCETSKGNGAIKGVYLLWASQTDASKSRYHSVSELDYSKSGWFQTGSESRNNGSGKTS